jgi:hypothetical protein
MLRRCGAVSGNVEMANGAAIDDTRARRREISKTAAQDIS